MKREALEKLSKTDLIDIILALTARIEELEARMNMNSKNSSKPPSSDGYSRPKSQRSPSGKKAGGQQGHEGSGMRLDRLPDSYKTYDPINCTVCPMYEECQATKTIDETRYELDINIEIVTTAHQTIKVVCPFTTQVLTGKFPEYITGTMQYGVNMEALAVSLNTIGMVSINRTHEILSGVFGVPISTGTISSMVSNCAKVIAPAVAEIKTAVINAPIIHSDETGTRVDKQTVWAHTASTDTLTYIEIQESRGKAGMDAIGILLAFLGTVIHDCWATYFRYQNLRHGLCNAHLLRELTAVWENTGQRWSQELINLLLDMKTVKERFLTQNQQTPTRHYINKFTLAYDRILSDALAQNPIPERDPTKRGKQKRGKTGALVDRLILHKDKFILFFMDFDVPFDNNQAERDIRMFKVKQKVSGCFRTMDGARDFAAISSFVGTARKHGVSGFNAIKNALCGKTFEFHVVPSTE